MSFDAIIAKVKAHPELWQSSHPFYRHRVVTAKTWKEIAAELNSDEMFVRKRWKHLKDHYRKEYKKVVTKMIPMTFWTYYKDLHFLSDSTLHIDMSNAIEVSEEGAGEIDPDAGNNTDCDDAILRTKIIKKALTKPMPPRKLLKRTKVKKTRGIYSLIRKTPDSGQLNIILNKLMGMEQAFGAGNDLTGDMSIHDSDYTFLLSLLPIMKKLTAIQKLQFRGKMNEWLLDIVARNAESDQVDFESFLQDIKPPID